MSHSEGELICFQLIAKRQLSRNFPSFQISQSSNPGSILGSATILYFSSC